MAARGKTGLLGATRARRYHRSGVETQSVANNDSLRPCMCSNTQIETSFARRSAAVLAVVARSLSAGLQPGCLANAW